MAYANEAKSTAIRETTVSTAIEDFDPVIKRAYDCAERLNRLHDRIHGPRPSAVQQEAKDAPPHSLISAIQERRSRLVAIFDDMERTINGLEGGL